MAGWVENNATLGIFSGAEMEMDGGDGKMESGFGYAKSNGMGKRTVVVHLYWDSNQLALVV